MGYYSERTCPECLSIPCTDLCGVECECNEEHFDCIGGRCECLLHEADLGMWGMR